MRADDVDFLMVPGWTNSGPDHWQTRWETRLKNARRVVMPDFDRPVRDEWVDTIIAAVTAATRPVILVAHSCGVLATIHAAARLAPLNVAGALLVAPTDLEMQEAIASFVTQAGEGVTRPVGFSPLPTEKLAFPSVVVASRNDPFCAFETAQSWACFWGADFFDAGEAGHLNAASGYGPWPEGAMRLAAFLKGL